MRDQVLWRKMARIIVLLADRLDINQERAMDLFYNSDTYELFANPESGMQLLGDEYLVENIVRELQ